MIVTWVMIEDLILMLVRVGPSTAYYLGGVVFVQGIYGNQYIMCIHRLQNGRFSILLPRGINVCALDAMENTNIIVIMSVTCGIVFLNE